MSGQTLQISLANSHLHLFLYILVSGLHESALAAFQPFVLFYSWSSSSVVPACAECMLSSCISDSLQTAEILVLLIRLTHLFFPSY